MEVRFREFNPFNCWIWMRFPHPLGSGERGYLETAFDSWFYLGKLGASTPKTSRPTRRARSWAGWPTATKLLPAPCQP